MPITKTVFTLIANNFITVILYKLKAEYISPAGLRRVKIVANPLRTELCRLLRNRGGKSLCVIASLILFLLSIGAVVVRRKQ